MYMYTGYWSHYGHQPPNCHHVYPAMLVAHDMETRLQWSPWRLRPR